LLGLLMAPAHTRLCSNEDMQLKAELNAAIARLRENHVPSPRMNAELLMMFTLGCDRAYLYAHPERELTKEESQRYEEALAQRERGIPAQYITGHQEFWGMDLIVTPAVLIPRPETEHVIETVLRLVRELGEDEPGRVARSPLKKLRMVDVGTGSGCIALALAKELPEAEITAVDISRGALEIAQANADRLQFGGQICFVEGNLLKDFPSGSFDFVVSNPPYVGELEADQVQLEVRKFEPRRAVFAGPKGTEVIERLLSEAREVLKARGWLIMEISGTIAEQVKLLLQDWYEVSVINDLQGIPRVIAARKQT
jgi:release factor glutamine methyltransferase